jgi:N,N'-diacetyllegionaminate synthase
MKNNKITLIAEAGVNHNGSIVLAKKLIDIAKKANSDFVKFQTFKAENLATKTAPKAQYQIQNSKNKKETQFEMLKKLELNFQQHIELIDYCNQKNIKFLSTPFDEDSFKILKKLDQNIFKISSSDLNNYPFLEFISKECYNSTNIILSTGMSNLNEVKKAFKYVTKHNIKPKNVSILHCTSNYPAKIEMLNLHSISYLKKIFKKNDIGYSDHSNGDLASILAIGLGAKIIEKHFTIKNTLKGPDHKASMEKRDFYNFAEKIHLASKALGVKNEKKIMQTEISIKKIARKSLHARINIKKGEKFTQKNISIKRPSTGLSPENYYKILGKVSRRNYKKDEKLRI